MHNLNFGTGKRVEDRIGYPTMDIKNNTTTPPVKKSDKPAKATKPEEKTTKKANRTARPQKTRGNWGNLSTGAVMRTRETLRNIRDRQR